MKLVGKYCIFKNEDANMSRYFYLEEDGTIKNIDSAGNDNEAYWEEIDGRIFLYDTELRVTSSLDLDVEESEKFNNDFLFFKGKSIYGPKLSITCLPCRTSLCWWTTSNLKRELIAQGKLTTGYHTYGNFEIVDDIEDFKIQIGDYCSIADGTKFIARNHRTDLVSTYPFDDMREYWGNCNFKVESYTSKNKKIVIGNDVWIAKDVTILPGVSIGDGAVIAAGAVVTSDVAPYSIVGGVPAKVVKKRCSDEQAEKMLQIKWWNWDEELVSERIDDITSMDIESFIAKYYDESQKQEG